MVTTPMKCWAEIFHQQKLGCDLALALAFDGRKVMAGYYHDLLPRWLDEAFLILNTERKTRIVYVEAAKCDHLCTESN